MAIFEGFYRFPIRTTNAGHKFFDNFATAQSEDRDPEIIKLELQREIAKFEDETAIYIAELNHESAMLKIAQDREIRIEDIGSPTPPSPASAPAHANFPSGTAGSPASASSRRPGDANSEASPRPSRSTCSVIRDCATSLSAITI